MVHTKARPPKGQTAQITDATSFKLNDDEGFVVHHFAGDVCYISSAAQAKQLEQKLGGSLQGRRRGTVMRHEAFGIASSDSWLNKNRDKLLPELAAALAASESPLLASLFEHDAALDEPGKKGRSAPMTVSRKVRRASTRRSPLLPSAAPLTRFVAHAPAAVQRRGGRVGG